jgi:outer membrane murein-binding lipoprotein Lpp
MSKRASLYLFPRVLRVAVVGVLCLCGCGREGSEGLETKASANMLGDLKFREKLEKQVSERNDLAGLRHRLVTKMEAMVEEMKAKMPKADDAAIKAELEKSAEWVSLYKKVVDVNTAIEDNQRKSTKMVGEKMKEQKEISK